MNRLLRRMPLAAKVLLIVLVPLSLLIYLSIQLYKEKSAKVELLAGYIAGINQAANINNLIDQLQSERRFSFDYAIKKDFRGYLVQQRPVTDSAIQQLERVNENALKGFQEYTFLKSLDSIRSRIDTSNLGPNEVMHYYTTVIFRLNLLNPVSPVGDRYLEAIYPDLVAQKILSEMITYLGILRSNLYNVLYTRKYMVETVIGLRGVHEVYDTYEIEFLAKAAPAAKASFINIRSNTDLKPTMEYINKIFSTFSFDSTYDAEEWWLLSANGAEELKKLQRDLWTNVRTGITAIYDNEKSKKNKAVILLVFGLLLVTFIIAYTVQVITVMLKELKIAAQKISRGETGIHFKVLSNDIIGDLGDSISRIDENNRKLADAAHAIGSGDFATTVIPRSEKDLLGNALVKMKKELELFSREKDLLLQKKDEFMSIASHELKTPITSVKASLQIVERLTKKAGMEDVNAFVMKANKQVTKLINIVNDLLDITKIQTGKLELNKSQFRVKELIDECTEQFHLHENGHRIIIEGNLGPHVQIYADKHRMEQVLNNLLSNAIKYSPGESQVLIKVEEHKQFLKILVTDHGIGISEEKIPLLFDRFFRVEQSSQNFSGLGLGLYISAEIVKSHKGEIGVISKPGEGSTFWINIPT